MKKQVVDLTIVGGQPPRRRRPWRAKIPGGIELVLHRASKEPAFAAALLADRAAALASCGVRLTPTERAALDAAPDDVLSAIVAGLRARNRERSPSPTMRVITAAAASLAAGTAECGDVPVHGGADAGVDVVWGADAGVVGDQWAPPLPPNDASDEASADAETDAAVDADDASADAPSDGRSD